MAFGWEFAIAYQHIPCWEIIQFACLKGVCKLEQIPIYIGSIRIKLILA